MCTNAMAKLGYVAAVAALPVTMSTPSLAQLSANNIRTIHVRGPIPSPFYASIITADATATSYFVSLGRYCEVTADGEYGMVCEVDGPA